MACERDGLAGLPDALRADLRLRRRRRRGGAAPADAHRGARALVARDRAAALDDDVRAWSSSRCRSAASPTASARGRSWRARAASSCSARSSWRSRAACPSCSPGRALIGIANGIIWTAGVMLAGAPGRPAGATGRAIAAGGTGLLVGPVMAGLLADRVGTWAPFAAGAALALPVTIVFALDRSAPVAARRTGARRPAARRRAPQPDGRLRHARHRAARLRRWHGQPARIAPPERERPLAERHRRALLDRRTGLDRRRAAGRPHGRAAQPRGAHGARLRPARRAPGSCPSPTARPSRSLPSCWPRRPVARA